MTPRTTIAVVAAGLTVLAGCTGNGDGTAATTTTSSSTTTTSASGRSPTTSTTTTTAPAPSDPDISGVEARLDQVASADTPTDIAFRPGDRRTMYVAERPGRVVAIQGDDSNVVLDLTGDISTEGERGLLGIVFSLDGRLLYVHHSDADGHNQLAEYQVRANGTVRQDSRRELLTVEQDSPVHKAGDLALDDDGLLYVALGDGGPPGDPEDHAQDLGDLRGSILRIDPRPAPDGRPYRIPTDNPHVDRPAARAEIWVHGLRNPWRISVDRPTGDLWIGDVGQFIWEEIDHLPRGEQAGANLGWNRFEGAHRFAEASGPPPEEHVEPLHEYNHDDGGCAVTGGVVYRGSDIDGLAGAYLFTDVCDGRVRGLTHRDGEVLDVRVLVEGPSQVVAFGQDLDGEVFLASLDGRIMKLVAAV